MTLRRASSIEDEDNHALCYIAYPSSLILRSANAIQTYNTCKELRRQAPGTLILLPRLPGRPSEFSKIGARHLLRLPFNVFNHIWPTILWSYLERSWFVWVCAIYLLFLRFTRGRRYRIIYVRDIVCAFWLGFLLQHILKAKIIYEVHDLEQRHPSGAKSRWLLPWIRFMDARALKGASIIVSLTQAFQRQLIERYSKRYWRIAVIPDAYDAEVYRPRDRAESRARLHISQNIFLVVYAGLTFSYRRLDLLIAAFSTLSPTIASSALYLVGGRPAEIAELRAQAARSSVVFTGQLPVDQIPLYLAAADVLVIPDTVTQVTASPLKMFEYMAMGRPVVLPDIPALREILPDRAAIFFPRGDEEALTQALLSLAGSPELALRLGQAAAAAAAPYTYALRAGHILDLAATL